MFSLKNFFLFFPICLRVFPVRSTSVKSNLQVFRAKFSEITPNSIRRACETLTEPDRNISDAVDVRQELDLRIGTGADLHLRFPHSGPPRLTSCHSRLAFLSFRCLLHSLPDPPPAEDLSGVAGQSADFLRQLSVPHSGLRGGAFQSHPGFHTRDLLQDQRYRRASRRDAAAERGQALPAPRLHCLCFFFFCSFFLPVLHEVDEDTVEFSWKRNRLFNHTACLVLYQICMEVCVGLIGLNVARKLVEMEASREIDCKTQPSPNGRYC